MLRNYPNPDRKGCGGTAILREMAEKELPHEHPFWAEHVSHCSPCYREFLDFRNQTLVRQSRNRTTKLVITAIVGLIVVAGSVYLSLRQRPGPQPPTANEVTPPLPSSPQSAPAPSVLTAILNLESESVTRSVPGGAPDVVGEIQRIPRGRLALSIYLPLGSEPGQYEVHLLRNPSDQTPMDNSIGTAQIESGLTTLRITPDFSRFDPGPYILAIRRGTGSWRYYRFVLS